MFGAVGALVLSLPAWSLIGADESRRGPDPERFASAIAAFEEADRARPPEAGGILFLGSSSIVRWDLEGAFPEHPIVNRGFGGSHLSDVCYYARRVVRPYRPRMVLIYAGDNDLADGKSAEQVLRDFRRLAGKVRRHAPGAPIVFLAIKPSPSREHRWPEARRANDLIRRECAQSDDLEFLDVASPLLDADGRMRPELYAPDRLHLADEGYEAWNRVIAPVLERPVVVASARRRGGIRTRPTR